MRRLAVALAFLLVGCSSPREIVLVGPVTPAPLVLVPGPSLPDLSLPSDESLQCLASNVYFEARGEGKIGMEAVAHVTLNRVRMGFGPDVCSVVHFKLRGHCAFSWYCAPHVVHSPDSWAMAMEVARESYVSADPTNGATYFHTKGVHPRWRGLTRACVIGRHIFYRS